MKRFFIETFGCQMNKSDSELISTVMKGAGHQEADSIYSADIIIFNTCSVRQHAEDRAFARVRETRALSKPNKSLLVVCGCMVQRSGERFIKNKLADIIVGPYQVPDMPFIINDFFSSKGKCKREYISTERDDFKERIHPGLVGGKDGTPWHKYVTISHGCENFCTYCIVPYVRGPLISFPSKKIIDYVKSLADSGVFEVTLLGQNVNQYSCDSGDVPFHELLSRIAAIEGLKKINFLTSHPKDFHYEIIDVIKENENIARAIHLPLQSGSDEILKRMNRGYTFDHYMRIVEKLRSSIDVFSLSTDLIVAFPGETREDFQKTLDAVRQIEFDEAFMYAYSPREGTEAFLIKECLTKNEKIQRLNELINIQHEILEKKLLSRVGKRHSAIFERASKKNENSVFGKTDIGHMVVMEGGEEDIGKIIDIEITQVRGHTLYGRKV